MEQDKILKLKLEVFEKALKGFQNSLSLDLNNFDEITTDTIQNGRIQKFEYCSELLWKSIKKYLFIIHGIDSKSPKLTIKNFFSVGLIPEEVYEIIMDILDSRNRLSHLYKEEFFNEIIQKLLLFYFSCFTRQWLMCWLY